MQLPLVTDYALRMLMYLGARGDAEDVVPIQDIADAYGVSRHYLLKVANELARFGYIDAVRGRGGGVRLVVDLREIRLGDVVRRTEPARGVLDCVGKDDSDCPIHEACGFRRILGEAQAQFYQVLDRYTLADALGSQGGVSRLLGLSEPISATPS
jgi:Rrf2 family nitric oxide-sensitive transcriptional repressor